MPGHRCIVPGCKSGYDSCVNKYHFFTVPKDLAKLELWKKAIPRKEFVFKPRQVVCELHFHEEDIIRTKKITDINGKIVVEAPYKIPRLKENAVPSIFPNCPKYLSRPLKHRKPPLLRINPDYIKKNNNLINQENIITVQNNIQLLSFSRIQENINSIVIPKGWSTHIIEKQLIMFSYYSIKIEKQPTYIPTPFIFKRVCVGINLNIKCYKFGLEKICSIAELEELVKTFDNSSICSGFKVDDDIQSQKTFIDLAGTQRHFMCQYILEGSKKCEHCTRAERSLNRQKLRLKINNTPHRIRLLVSHRYRNQLQRLRMRHNVTRNKKNRTMILNKKFKNNIFNLQKQISELTSISLEERLLKNAVPNNQRIALLQILSASQVNNKKGCRYSEDWLLLCILFHMRSPCGYNFIRNHDIMPLPCVRTIRR
ncbi:uncharacterized protein LOC115033917 [Acyrthosiphon pisum]|uniref:THAP-type domain-containing protein n=1 Tax=Acyrthosiphon pisum TaxID=7029 RepID=A0A8R2JRC5_ACYPI|nr:uncharacterized protein LOC115033917 [Acyrthosiphon pisum]